MTLIITADQLPRFMGCNGSIAMTPTYWSEEDNSAARDEGTAAHYMANAVFQGKSTLEEMIDRKAPNGAYMSAEMAEHVEGYLSLLDQSGQTEVDTSFAGQGWEVRARSDYVFHNLHDLIVDHRTGEVLSEPNTLHVYDFKYGFTIVEPEMHWTLIAHAVGYCIRNNATPQKILLTIYQPRPPWHPDGKLRTWSLSYDQLLQLYTQISNTLSNPSQTLQTGPWCDKCPSTADCPAYRMKSYEAHEVTSRIFVDNMSNEALSKELDLIRSSLHTLKNRNEALEELASFRIRNGQVIENYAREQGYGNRRWNTGLTAEFLTALTGIDLADKPSPVTPAEARRRGVSEDVVSSLSIRPKTTMKLVRVSADKRAKRLLKNK